MPVFANAQIAIVIPVTFNSKLGARSNPIIRRKEFMSKLLLLWDSVIAAPLGIKATVDRWQQSGAMASVAWGSVVLLTLCFAYDESGINWSVVGAIALAPVASLSLGFYSVVWIERGNY